MTDQPDNRPCPPAALDRRGFMLAAGAVGASLVVPGRAVARARPAHRGRPGRARNVIFMVADGMSYGTLGLAESLIRQRTGRSSNWAGLMLRDDVSRSLVDTRAANSMVTDSAAAATAWAIGELVDNGRIGLTPDGRMPTPILMHARQAGRAIGLVTTTRITHATPAGFICNVPTTRDDENGIAEQMIARAPDVMLGGGSRFVSDGLLAAAGFNGTLVRTGSELAAIDPAAAIWPIVGLFAHSHMSYEIDRLNAPSGADEPSLAAMTRVALATLGRAPGGFAVQIEGGRVDHGAHANDAGATIFDQVAFDEAIGVAWEFVQDRDDTLLIVTSDHSTANPGLTEYGGRGNRGFELVHGFRHSFEWIDEQLGTGMTLESNDSPQRRAAAARSASFADIPAQRLREVVQAAAGIAITDDEIAMLHRWKRGEMVDPFMTNNVRYAPLSAVLANHTGIAFLSPNHTADPVEFTAWGPGSELVPGVMAINHAHSLMVHALDLRPAKPL